MLDVGRSNSKPQVTASPKPETLHFPNPQPFSPKPKAQKPKAPKRRSPGACGWLVALSALESLAEVAVVTEASPWDPQNPKLPEPQSRAKAVLALLGLRIQSFGCRA